MKKNRVGPEFLQNTTYRFLNLGISYLGGAIFTVIIARLLEPELFGVYTLSLSFALVLMTIGDLGIGEAMLRYVSRYYDSPSKAKAYIYYLFKIKIIVLLFLSLLLAVF
jgi:stage V sporulation protein B